MLSVCHCIFALASGTKCRQKAMSIIRHCDLKKGGCTTLPLFIPLKKKYSEIVF